MIVSSFCSRFISPILGGDVGDDPERGKFRLKPRERTLLRVPVGFELAIEAKQCACCLKLKRELVLKYKNKSQSQLRVFLGNNMRQKCGCYG